MRAGVFGGWAGDTSLWSGTDEDEWLGWLNIVEQELADIDRLTAFAKDVKPGRVYRPRAAWDGRVSLGPEVFGKTSDNPANWPRFHMLDSTDPTQIKAIEQAVDIGKTLFIVSSKSGSTLEPNIFMDYFHDRVCVVRGKDKAGECFVAVTDPGSSLARRTKELGFAHIFYGVASIGGRYSVLSKFGLVPAAAIGLDVKRLLETVRPMRRACRRPGRAVGGEPRRTTRHRHGNCSHAFRPRQSYYHCLAGDRRSRRLAGAASGREHGQARAWADPVGR